MNSEKVISGFFPYRESNKVTQMSRNNSVGRQESVKWSGGRSSDICVIENCKSIELIVFCEI